MDTSDKGISFDKNGVCNHCLSFDKTIKPYILADEQKEILLKNLVYEIKEAGKKSEYDCIVGLSGGVDSSYVAYIAKKFNLKALIVHLDNGWNSELAEENIKKVLDFTGFDFVKIAVETEEFINIQKIYFKASVVDVEVPTDMAIISAINKIAVDKNIKYILSGVNLVMEFTMGKDWNFSKMDRSNFDAIISEYGIKKLNSFPYYSPYKQLMFRVKRIKSVNILQYTTTDYNKIKATLKETFDWKEYAVKHGESEFTNFYQSYYLPKKFGIDKRRAHLADEVRAGTISRESALSLLQKSPYESEKEMNRNYEFTLNRLGFTNEEFDEIMKSHPVPHDKYLVNEPYGSFIDKLILALLSKRKIISGLSRIYNAIN